MIDRKFSERISRHFNYIVILQKMSSVAPTALEQRVNLVQMQDGIPIYLWIRSISFLTVREQAVSVRCMSLFFASAATCTWRNSGANRPFTCHRMRVVGAGTDIVLKKMTVEECQCQGVYVYEGAKLDATECHFQQNGEDGVYVYGSTTTARRTNCTSHHNKRLVCMHPLVLWWI